MHFRHDATKPISKSLMVELRHELEIEDVSLA
jgi:hypothetical protein